MDDIELLRESSPKLFVMLTKRLGPPELMPIVEAYALAKKLGGWDEHPIKRSPGVRFNPKPARIIEILVEECGETRPELLAIAALCCAKVGNEHALYSQLNSLASFESGATSAISPELERVALAKRLDLLRHLHMSDLNTQQRVEIIDSTAEMVAAGQADPINARLHEMIRAWLLRQSRSSNARYLPRESALESLPQ